MSTKQIIDNQNKLEKFNIPQSVPQQIPPCVMEGGDLHTFVDINYNVEARLNDKRYSFSVEEDPINLWKNIRNNIANQL